MVKLVAEVLARQLVLLLLIVLGHVVELLRVEANALKHLLIFHLVHATDVGLLALGYLLTLPGRGHVVPVVLVHFISVPALGR